jgi:hypothetical protein
MVLGKIERHACRQRWCNVLSAVFVAVAVHVMCSFFQRHCGRAYALDRLGQVHGYDEVATVSGGPRKRATDVPLRDAG